MRKSAFCVFMELTRTESFMPSHTNDGWVYHVPVGAEIVAIRQKVIDNVIATHIFPGEHLRSTMMRIGSPYSIKRDLEYFGISISTDQSFEACAELLSRIREVLGSDQIETESTGLEITGGMYRLVMLQLKFTEQWREMRRPLREVVASFLKDLGMKRTHIKSFGPRKFEPHIILGKFATMGKGKIYSPDFSGIPVVLNPPTLLEWSHLSALVNGLEWIPEVISLDDEMRVPTL